MKIEISFKELKAFKEVASTLKEINGVMSSILDLPVDTENLDPLETVAKINAGKVAKVSIGLTGITLDINPEFIEEVLNLYGGLVARVGMSVADILLASTRFNEDIEETVERWS